MAGDLVETAADQRRAENDREEDVTGRDRHPHAENEAGDRAEKQQQIDIAARELQQLAREGATDAGIGQRPDDQADTDQNADDVGDVLGRIDDQILHALPAEPVFPTQRSEEHTSELQSLMRISYAVFSLK